MTWTTQTASVPLRRLLHFGYFYVDTDTTSTAGNGTEITSTTGTRPDPNCHSDPTPTQALPETILRAFGFAARGPAPILVFRQRQPRQPRRRRMARRVRHDPEDVLRARVAPASPRTARRELHAFGCAAPE